MLNVLAGRKLPIYGDGKQIRDWLFVDDHCLAIDKVIDSGTPGETYNVGGNNEWANIDVVELLCGILNDRFRMNVDLSTRFVDSPCAYGISANTLIQYVADRPGHDTRYAIDAGKIGSELGFTPANSFESGLNKTVDWYLENEAWWTNIANGGYLTGRN